MIATLHKADIEQFQRFRDLCEKMNLLMAVVYGVENRVVIYGFKPETLGNELETFKTLSEQTDFLSTVEQVFILGVRGEHDTYISLYAGEGRLQA